MDTREIKRACARVQSSLTGPTNSVEYISVVKGFVRLLCSRPVLSCLEKFSSIHIAVVWCHPISFEREVASRLVFMGHSQDKIGYGWYIHSLNIVVLEGFKNGRTCKLASPYSSYC